MPSDRQGVVELHAVSNTGSAASTYPDLDLSSDEGINDLIPDYVLGTHGRATHHQATGR